MGNLLFSFSIFCFQSTYFFLSTYELVTASFSKMHTKLNETTSHLLIFYKPFIYFHFNFFTPILLLSNSSNKMHASKDYVLNIMTSLQTFSELAIILIYFSNFSSLYANNYVHLSISLFFFTFKSPTLISDKQQQSSKKITILLLDGLHLFDIYLTYFLIISELDLKSSYSKIDGN